MCVCTKGNAIKIIISELGAKRKTAPLSASVFGEDREDAEYIADIFHLQSRGKTDLNKFLEH